MLQLPFRFHPIQPRQWIYARDLLYTLVMRDMKLRYKRSVLGAAWSLLNPLAQLLVLGLVFSRILPLDIPNYTLFLFIGLLTWNWFQASLFSGTGVIVDNPGLIKQPGFPAAILPIVNVTTHLVHFLLALPILGLFLIWEKVPLTSAIVALPIIIVIQFVFSVSLSYFIATIHVTFRDTQYLLGVGLMLGFYLSPVFYDANRIPAQYHFLYDLNPLVHFIDAYRTILIDGAWPNPWPFIWLNVVNLLLLQMGYKMFRRAGAHFVEAL